LIYLSTLLPSFRLLLLQLFNQVHIHPSNLLADLPLPLVLAASSLLLLLGEALLDLVKELSEELKELLRIRSLLIALLEHEELAAFGIDFLDQPQPLIEISN